MIDFPLVAVDTETTNFDEPCLGWKGKTRIRPFGGMKFICGSYWEPTEHGVLRFDAFADVILRYLDRGFHLVYHNASFDHRVLTEAAGPTGRLTRALHLAVDSGKVHDTKDLELLLQIARGSQTINSKALRSKSLQALAKERLGVDLSKDERRVTFDQFLDPTTEIPQDYLDYAQKDAEVTYKVFESQWKEAELYAADIDRERCLPDCRAGHRCRRARSTPIARVQALY